VTYDASRLDENERFKIAPEIVIEILSKSTREYDCNEKLDLYRDAGADEYWIIDPENKSVTVHYFKSDEKHVFCVGDMIESKFLDILCFKVEDIFRVR
jgi:Uma2 family endonuclease